MSLALGCDEAALDLKNLLKAHLEAKGLVVKDFGVHTSAPAMYPDIALEVSLEIAAGHFDRGILLCGTGLGMAITANKVFGIRAATCHDTYSAERARKSNDAQILTMGARVVGSELAKTIVDAWLASEFQGGGSTAKVERIKQIEKKHLRGDQ
jgi:ribose 5-phosphate isomerase B